MSFLRNLSCLLVVASCSAIMPAQNAGSDKGMDQNAKSIDSADKTFATKAAQGGQAEVELGKLAAQKASDPQVKQFGQRMVDDHSKANDQLKQWAAGKNVQLPQQPDAKERKKKDHLASLSGADFDRAYMKHMVEDHQQDVKEFQQHSSNGKDEALKEWVSQTLPTLQEHLKQAQQIQGSVGGGTGASKSH